MSREEKDRKAGGTLGLAPAVVGGVGYYGAERSGDMFRDALRNIAMETQSGIPITSAGKTPLQEIAEFTGKEVADIQRFAKSQGVTVPILAAGPKAQSSFFAHEIGPIGRMLGDGADYLTPNAHIGLKTTSVPTAMHEIGHASPALNSHRLRRALQLAAESMRPSSLAGGITRGAILSNVLLPPDEESGKTRRFMYDHAPELMGAASLPLLVEEGRASLNAMKGARGAGISTLNALKDLAPSYGTYLAGAIAPVVATVFAKKVVQILHDAAKRKQSAHDRGEEKQAAAAPAPVPEKAKGALRASLSSSWRIGGTPPKPVTTKPKIGNNSKAVEMPKAAPPSNRPYHHDLLDSLYNPGRGFRVATGT